MNRHGIPPFSAALLLLPLLSLLAPHARAELRLRKEDVSLSGTARRLQLESDREVAAPGVEVLVEPVSDDGVDTSKRRRARTDLYGKFAFYELAPGTYRLRIHKQYGRYVSREVTVPTRLNPIILPPLLPTLPDSIETPVSFDADYRELQSESDRRLFRFTFETRIPSSWQPHVDSVVYFFNHPTFNPKYRKAAADHDGYTFSYNGWGCLENVVVFVHFRHDVWDLDLPHCDLLRRKSGAR